MLKAIFTSLFAIWSCSLYSTMCGKVDFGPVYIHIDVLESGKTVKRIDMPGIKSDACIVLFDNKGWALKPSLLYGNSRSGEAASAGIGFGHCTPITECLTITPSIGVTWGYVRTRIKIHEMEFLLGKVKFTEKFRSVSPYLSLDATYKFWECWRICAMFQYAWSRTHTTIEGLLKDKSNAKGPNYALLLEYDLNSHWTLQLGGAYNISLSKEKHGIRAAGAKIGAAYWF